MSKAQQTLLKVFLFLFAFSLPISIAAAELSLGLAALLVSSLVFWGARDASLLRIPLFLPLLVFLAGHAISALSGPDPLGSLSSIDWVFITMPFTVVALRSTECLKGPVFTFIGVGILVSIYAVAQHYLGIDLVRSAERAVIIPMEGMEDRYLAVGTFCHHLTYAHLYQFIFLFIFTVVLTHLKDRKHLWWAVPGAGIVGLSRVFSFSRGVWVSAAVGSIGIAAVLWKGRGAIYVAISVVVLLILLSANGSLGGRLRSITSLEANDMRVIIFRSNWDAAMDNPILGIGPGRYEETMTPYYERYDPPEIMPRVHAHNNFLQVWLNAGLIGLAGFLWLNGAFFKRAWRNLRRGEFKRPIERTVLLAGAAGVLAFLIGGLTQYSLGDSEVAMTYWFVMGVALWVMERQESVP